MAEPIDPQIAASKELTGRIGKYDIVRLLGRGAMGQVYLAHDTMLDRDVALKVMVAQIADDPELKQRFEREARAVAKMTHPNVVTVFDLGSHTDGSPYIAMELLRGQDLQRAMRQGPPMPLERKVAIIVNVLAGLAHAHKAGIVHRDIKPANIFIQEDGSVKIMDFGVARLTTASMTGTGNIVGTADYMSPEQVQGAKVDGRSDLFSVGCMLFELVAGRRPFHSDSLMAIFYKITHEEPSFDLIPEGPEYDSLLPLLQKALAKDVKDRYQNAYEFAIALRDWLKGHPGSVATQQALESIVGLEPGTSSGTRPPGATEVIALDQSGATVDLSARGTGPVSRRTSPGTRGVGPTVVDSRPATRVTQRAGARVEPQPRRTWPLVAAGIGLMAVAGAGLGLWRWRASPAAPATVPATQAIAAATAAPTLPPASPPATFTAAPPPTMVQAEGRAAASIRGAQTAFRSGDYDRALTLAQQALREDAASAAAKTLVENALAGQRAALHVRAGEAALGRGDLAAATSEASEALAIAAWDRSAAELRNRIETARRDADARAQQKQRESEAGAQRARAEQINKLLIDASNALEKRQYDAAIEAYGRVLEMDPGNVAAHTGKSNALTSKTVAEAAVGRPAAASARGFVSGRTEAKPPESASSAPAGFEESAGVVVKRATQSADLPGRIVFEPQPASPQPGERFAVLVYLRNEGSQPIQLATMTVATTIDGKTQRGAVAPLTRTVAPRDRALVFQIRDQTWRETTSAWSMEILLHGVSGETYRNTLSWK